MEQERTTLDVALALAARGFHVFPIIADGKLPAIKAFPERATRDADAVRAFWTERDPVFDVERVRDFNVGIYTGRFADAGALLVVDVDDKNGKNGSVELARLDVMEGVPDTLTAVTPTGGRHLLYAVPEPLKTGVNILGNGLDTRSGGGYIVAAGSTIDGKPYTWQNDAPIVEAPQWMATRVGKTAKRKTDTSHVVEYLDTPANINRVIDYLTNVAPVAVKGQGGDATTYKVAAAVKDFGVSELAAVELLFEHYNPRCPPGWSYDRLATKVGNAYHYGTKAAGSSAIKPDDFTPVEAGAAPMLPVEAPPPKKTVADLGFVDADDYDETTLKATRWLIGNLAAIGYVTALVAPPGIGKSALSLAIAAAVASGSEAILKMPVHISGAVALVNCEDDNDDLRKRLQALRRLTKVDATDGHSIIIKGGSRNRIKIATVGQDRKVVATPDAALIVEFVKQNDVKLIVFDPLIELHNANENDNSEMADVMAIFRWLAEEADCAVIVIHHSRKLGIADSEGHRGNMDTARGASAIMGNVRRSLSLFTMDEKTGDKFGVDRGIRHRYVVLDDQKSNHTDTDPSGRYFFKEGVDISTGENIVAIRPARDDELNDRTVNLAITYAEELIAISFERNVDQFTLNDACKALAQRPMFHTHATDTGVKTQFRTSVQEALAEGVQVSGYRVAAVEKKVVGASAKTWIEVSKCETAADVMGGPQL